MQFAQIVVLAGLIGGNASVAAGEPGKSGVGQSKLSLESFRFFESKIRPVLVEHCYKRHSAEAEKNKKLRGGLLRTSGSTSGTEPRRGNSDTGKSRRLTS